MAYLDYPQRKKEKKEKQEVGMTEKEILQGARLIKEGKAKPAEFMAYIYIKRIIKDIPKKEK